MTEGETIQAVEKLLDGLHDEGRARVVEWVRGRYAKASPTVTVPLGPTVTPPTWIPLPYPVPMTTPVIWPSPWYSPPEPWTIITCGTVFGGPQRPDDATLYRS